MASSLMRVLSRKRSRTSTIISEYAHDLLQEDVLDGSIRIDEGTGSGRFVLRELASLGDEQIASLTKQADIITSFKNVAGNIVLTFSQRGDIAASASAASASASAAAPPSFSSEELSKFVRPCDIVKIEEIVKHLFKCIPGIETVSYKHETPQDRNLVIVIFTLRLDSASIRAVRAHRDVAEVSIYPHKKTTLAIEVSIRQ